MTNGLRRAGFIGLGVMGEPMCRNLAVKSGLPVAAYDVNPAPLERLVHHGVTQCASVREAVADADGVFVPSVRREAVSDCAHAADGSLAICKSHRRGRRRLLLARDQPLDR